MEIMDLIENIIVPQIKQPLWRKWYIKDVENPLGKGASSIVYRVEASRETRTDVAALKVEAIVTDRVFQDFSTKKSFLDQQKNYAENETSIMTTLQDCPYIVRYQEEDSGAFNNSKGEFEGYYYLIRMELLDNVADMMNRGKFQYSEENVKKLALEIGKGLKFAHEHKVIHRDVKPQNLFISKSGIYKLGDFNISKRANLTHTVAGTFYWMSPEVYRAKDAYTNQADIYSLGICLYQMMNNGLFPFEDDTLDPEKAFDMRMSGTPISPPCNASPEFSKIIMKACAYQTAERYASMDEMLDDLKNMGKAKTYQRKSPADNYSSTVSANPKSNPQSSTESPSNNQTVYAGSQTKNQKKYLLVWLIVAVGVIIALLMLFHEKKKPSPDPIIETNSSEEIFIEITTEELPIETEQIIEEIVTEKITEEITEEITEVITEPPTTEPITEESTTEETVSENEATNVIYLANLELFANESEGYVTNTYLTDNYRNDYHNSISVDKGSVAYLVKDLDCKLLHGIVALPKDITPDSYKTSAQLEIFVDDILVFRSETLTSESKPEEFNIDITGAEVIKFSWSCAGGNVWSNWCYYATIFDAYIADEIEEVSSVTEQTEKSETIAYLSNEDLFAKNGEKIYSNEYLVTNYNEKYLSSFSVDKGYASFLVKDRNFIGFTGIIALPKEVTPDSFKTSAQLDIYIDGELVFRSETFTSESKPQEFNIDITNAEVVKIEWSCTGNNIWDNWCYYATIFDGYFYSALGKPDVLHSTK